MAIVMLGLCALVATAVFGVMLLAAYASYRSRRATEASSGSFVVELIWSVIPWLIVIGAATPAAVVIIRGSRAAIMLARAFGAGG